MANDDLQRALEGDINAFHALYAEFRDDLKSYLFRLVVDRRDAEDLTHDTFVKAFDKLSSFQQASTLKTWVFSIATHLAFDLLKGRKRWAPDILDQARDKAVADDFVKDYLLAASVNTPQGAFELMEHIDFCFTCISKTLPLEHQLALMLKDIYEFKVHEIALIVNKSEAAVKHYVRLARQTMTRIYDSRCSLVNKTGACYQCSQLNDWLNPSHDMKQQPSEVEAITAANDSDRAKLFELREVLVRAVNPLKAKGTDLHEAFMRLHRLCSGEIESL